MKYYLLNKFGRFVPIEQVEYLDQCKYFKERFGAAYVLLMQVNGDEAIVLLNSELIRTTL